MPVISSQYSAPSIFFNAHLQTIFPALFRSIKITPTHQERLKTPDEDFLDLDWYRGGSSRLAILSHGLEGDSRRPYILGMIKSFFEKNWDCLAWNYRGCSGEINKLLRFYHSGATDDLDIIVNHALKEHYREVVLIGFSLGGNITLKYLGEKGRTLNKRIIRGITFSVPLDLHKSCVKISQTENFIYSRRFLRNLKKKIKLKSLAMPGQLDVTALSKIRSIQEFDDMYTAPLHGFKDAFHYYKSCSSIYFLENIAIPTLIVNARNDPFLSEECYPFEQLTLHPNVYFEAPKEGGHCGFISLDQNGYYWSEKRALEFALQDAQP